MGIALKGSPSRLRDRDFRIFPNCCDLAKNLSKGPVRCVVVQREKLRGWGEWKIRIGRKAKPRRTQHRRNRMV